MCSASGLSMMSRTTVDLPDPEPPATPITKAMPTSGSALVIHSAPLDVADCLDFLENGGE